MQSKPSIYKCQHVPVFFGFKTHLSLHERGLNTSKNIYLNLKFKIYSLYINNMETSESRDFRSRTGASDGCTGKVPHQQLEPCLAVTLQASSNGNIRQLSQVSTKSTCPVLFRFLKICSLLSNCSVAGSKGGIVREFLGRNQ